MFIFKNCRFFEYKHVNFLISGYILKLLALQMKARTKYGQSQYRQHYEKNDSGNWKL
jgi:hypothetical protein